MRINRIISRRLRDSRGAVVGDVNAAIAMNVGEPGGSEIHASSHSRVVQSSGTRGGQRTTDVARPTEPDERKEDA